MMLVQPGTCRHRTVQLTVRIKPEIEDKRSFAMSQLKHIESKIALPRCRSQYFKAVPQLLHLHLFLNIDVVYSDLKCYV